jgi:hypothetical protein
MALQGGYAPKTEDATLDDQAPIPTHGFGPRRGEEYPLGDANPGNTAADNTDVPAGFTYFGQFVDHDITFDPTALQETLVDPLAFRTFARRCSIWIAFTAQDLPRTLICMSAGVTRSV